MAGTPKPAQVCKASLAEERMMPGCSPCTYTMAQIEQFVNVASVLFDGLDTPGAGRRFSHCACRGRSWISFSHFAKAPSSLDIIL